MTLESSILVVLALNLMGVAAIFGHLKGQVSGHDKVITLLSARQMKHTVILTKLLVLVETHLATNPHPPSMLLDIKADLAQLSNGGHEETT